jgi:uncharacterized membrane-anchored protein
MNTSIRSVFQREINTVICNVFFAILYYAQFVTTINFIYRYLGIVHNRKLSGKEYIGMLSTLLSILVLFFIWNYCMTVPTNDNEFLRTQEYVEIFGGPNATNTDLPTCSRGDLVTYTILC